ncbi:hypothetical protein B0H19DRAFT_1277369 [Mycena capillaripes]|nr:hypothetical protein B0H19DRAFT_1277369 [Mycena capillaripes]
MSSFNVFGLFTLAQGKRIELDDVVSPSVTTGKPVELDARYLSAFSEDPNDDQYEQRIPACPVFIYSVGHAPAIHTPQTLKDGSKVFTLSATEYVCGTFKNSAVSPISSFAPPDAGFSSSTAYATHTSEEGPDVTHSTPDVRNNIASIVNSMWDTGIAAGMELCPQSLRLPHRYVMATNRHAKNIAILFIWMKAAGIMPSSGPETARYAVGFFIPSLHSKQ